MTIRHVVMFSGGLGSWATAKRVAEEHGTEEMVLLFADVKGDAISPHIGEDEDTYRFIHEAAENIGAPLVIVKDGRDIWQVFKDDRFLGNSRLANCSKLLKQKPCRDWLRENTDPAETTVYVGIDWTETHRLPAISRGWLPWKAAAPLTEAPYLDKDDVREWAEREGLPEPRLYAAGFPHNNCGGGCVRAGQGQFRLLLETNPERFAVWEAKEQEVRDHLEKDVTILRDRSRAARLQSLGLTEDDLEDVQEGEDGPAVTRNRRTGEVVHLPSVVPLTLRSFREGIEGKSLDVDNDDFGGCGCFVAEEGTAAEEESAAVPHVSAADSVAQQTQRRVSAQVRKIGDRKRRARRGRRG